MVEFPNPCKQDVSGMKRCGNRIECSICQKPVFDLSKKTTNQVHDFIKENPGECIAVHPRHEVSTSTNYSRIKRFEAFLLKSGFKKTALITTTVFIFLSSCASRKPKPAWRGKFKIPAEQNDQVFPGENIK